MIIVCSTLSEILQHAPDPLHSSSSSHSEFSPDRLQCGEVDRFPLCELWLAKENEGFLRGTGLRTASHVHDLMLPVVFECRFKYSSIPTGTPSRPRRPEESRIVLGSRPVANMEFSAPDENRKDS